jgi:SRSO17 transposase
MVYKISKVPMSGDISSYKDDLLLHKVDETKWEKTWDMLVNKYHYLGYESVIGARVKYLVSLGENIVGAISFCSAAYHLGPRDEYMGWDDETRMELLPNLVCNNRFLILPWVTIRNLASKVLSMSLRRLSEDWKKQYEITPYMAETFVDKENYLGTCYKAANWQYLGVTKGYGKIGNSFVYHGRVKDIYVYVMDRQFAKEFKPDIDRVKQIAKKRKDDNSLKQEKEKITAMMSGIPMWYEELLKKVGIREDFTEKIQPLFTEHMYEYTKLIGRKENKAHLIAMMQGLLGELKRKTIQAIALAYRGVSQVRNLTNFMKRSKWEDDSLKKAYQSDLSNAIGAEDGMITGDECGMPKKGNESVGVARQYCGNTGKVDNCQVGVMVGYVSPLGYGIADYNLYMPKVWCAEDYNAQRKKCGVPLNTKFRTKNEILLDSITKIVETGKFPAKYIGVDSAYGGDSDFLDSLPEGLVYFADVPFDTRVFTSRPETFIPEYSGKGKMPTKSKTEAVPIEVKVIAENPDIPWNAVVLGIGAKGPIITKDKIIPVVETRKGLPGKDVWLYVRRLENGKIKYALCNAPTDAPAEEVRKPALMRWSIEQCFNECKDYLGMDQYETRSWNAWHRHMLLTFIAHLFVIKLRALFSIMPNTPSPTPHIDTPVSFEDYLLADEQMKNNKPIRNPNITTMPSSAQRFLTIGLVCKLINETFIKVGKVLDEVDYLLRQSWCAFTSHSIDRLSKAKAAYGKG